MFSAIFGGANLFKWLGEKAFGLLTTFTNNDAVKYQAKTTAATGIAQAEGSFQTSVIHDMMTWRSTRWAIAATVWICVAHLGAVALDSIILHCHCIDKFPPAFENYEGTILLAPFVIAGSTGILRSIFGK